MKDRKNKQIEETENYTKYGEFICSFDHWLPIEEQKRKAEHLGNITNKKRKS